MANPIAVLVEDDLEQSEVSQQLLEDAGFEVAAFDSISSVRAFLSSSNDLIDMFVLDRRLPVSIGDTAADEFGDELLREVRVSHPDARIIVFTGYASVPHVQAAMAGSGQLPSQTTEHLDRVSVLEKHQSLEFKEQIEHYRTLLQQLADIEVNASDGSDSLTLLERRLARRLAFEYRGTSISIVPLEEGLTEAAVWRCEILRPEGHSATVVSKQVSKPAVAGGLAELLPHGNAAATVRTLAGLSFGRKLNVLQLAGQSPKSLMHILGENPALAADLTGTVSDVLDAVPSRHETLSIAELCAPIISWATLIDLLDSQSLRAPAATLRVTTSVGPRHGDLHASNILIDGQQPVLIDFDSEAFASGLLDPITLLLSTLTHPSSPIKGGQWPSVLEIDAKFGLPDFGEGHRAAVWFKQVNSWIERRRSSEREYWCLVLGFVARQFRFDDVLENAATVQRLRALAERAIEKLDA